MRLVANIALYQVGWFALVLGAASDRIWLGSGIAAAAIVGHLVTERPLALELKRIAWAVGIGLLLETTNLALGVYAVSVGTVGGWFAPWLLLLWAGFGTSLGRSLGWLSRRKGLAAFLGAIAGPMAFWGGERLGAVVLTRDPVLLGLLSLEWALALPTLIWISGSLERGERRVQQGVGSAAFVALLLLALALPATATAERGKGFRASCAPALPEGVVTRGAGLYEYLGWIDVLEASFFDAPADRGASPLRPVAKCLVIEYKRGFSARQFRKVTVEGIQANTDDATYARIEGQVEAFNLLYRDVEAGDRYALTFVPGRGTTLALNGDPLGLIEGDTFATALYSIWLGQVSMDRGLKRDLLGDRGRRP